NATLFIDASYDPSSTATASPDVPLASDTRDRAALITHHHGDHFDAPALRTLLGESGILVVPESVTPWADTRQLRVQAARAYGPFDLAFLPINGFRQVQGRYTDTGVAMSLTPEQAAAAAQVLRARLTVPIHYGHENANYREEPHALQRFTDDASARSLNV